MRLEKVREACDVLCDGSPEAQRQFETAIAADEAAVAAALAEPRGDWAGLIDLIESERERLSVRHKGAQAETLSWALDYVREFAAKAPQAAVAIEPDPDNELPSSLHIRLLGLEARVDALDDPDGPIRWAEQWRTHHEALKAKAESIDARLTSTREEVYARLEKLELKPDCGPELKGTRVICLGWYTVNKLRKGETINLPYAQLIPASDMTGPNPEDQPPAPPVDWRERIEIDADGDPMVRFTGHEVPWVVCYHGIHGRKWLIDTQGLSDADVTACLAWAAEQKQQSP